MQEKPYGIDKDYAHPKALELIPYEFFWDSTDELAPFGSDEGDTALQEWREWRNVNPEKNTKDCINWVIESVGEITFADYNSKLLDVNLIKSQLNDDGFDFEQYVNTLDISIIATGFGQLADEGKIDSEAKPTIKIALERQLIANTFGRYDSWPTHQYNIYLNKLKEILEKV